VRRPGHTYSLDLVLRDCSVIGLCIDANQIGSTIAVAFAGICPSAGDRLIQKSEVAKFRL